MSVARPTKGWLRSAVVCGTLLAAAALSLPAAARPYDPPTPPPVPLTQLLTQLQTLYQQTEAATESYNQAKETADKLRANADQVDRQLADQRVAVAASRDEIGLMARQMYQDGGVSPYLSMLSGQTPQDFFGRRHILERAAGHQQAVLGELTSGEARLTDLNTKSQLALDKAQHAQSVTAAQKTTVETRLKQVEAILAGLTGAQIQQLQKLEQDGVNRAQQDFLDSKALGDNPGLRAPSQIGDKAIAYAFMQLGKPYVWGAEGPDAFDCSGLTSQAWAHAGVVIPRTSQEQWAQLPRVPLTLLRPGDLVVYFSGASHVAIYIGDGLVIQAPRPGAFVKVSPIAANPVLGAVRPDPSWQPLKDYQPRPIPKDAEKPTPIAAEDPAPPPAHAAPPSIVATRPPGAPSTSGGPGGPTPPTTTPGAPPSGHPSTPPTTPGTPPSTPTSTPTPTPTTPSTPTAPTATASTPTESPSASAGASAGSAAGSSPPPGDPG